MPLAHSVDRDGRGDMAHVAALPASPKAPHRHDDRHHHCAALGQPRGACGDGRARLDWARTLEAIRDTDADRDRSRQLCVCLLEPTADALAQHGAANLFVEPTSAHNDWLQVTLEGGVPAILCFALTLLFSLRAAWRAQWLGGMGPIVAFAVAAIGDTPLRQPFALVSLLFVVAAAPSDAPISMRTPRLVPFVFVALGSVAFTLSLGDWMGARLATHARYERPLSRLRASRSRSGWPHARSTSRSSAPSPHTSCARRPAPPSTLLAAHAKRPTVGGEVAIGNSYFAAEQFIEAQRHYERALALDPHSFRAVINLGLTELRLHHLERARAALRRARTIYRYHPAADALADEIASHP
ncbi:MAG: tetratricopeptide repeat protein [Candidatus Nanopelagicales bacterium]